MKAPSFDKEIFKYQLLPPLKQAEWVALVDSIKEHGLEHPIEIDEDGNILDGHHRYLICEELGMDCPTVVKKGLTEEEKRSYARRVNIQRRHLDTKEKRNIIAELLVENESRSNNSIAKELGVSDSTVSKVRTELGFSSRVRIGADGKKYFVPESHYSTKGTLLDKIDTKLNPLHEVKYGQIWELGNHKLAILNIMNEWDLYLSLAQDMKKTSDKEVLLIPYPGPFIIYSQVATKFTLLMLQPVKYIAGTILDTYVERHENEPVCTGGEKNEKNWRMLGPQ